MPTMINLHLLEIQVNIGLLSLFLSTTSWQVLFTLCYRKYNLTQLDNVPVDLSF